EDGSCDLLATCHGWLRRPACPARVLQLLEVHLVEQREGVLAEVHRAARRIEDSEIARLPDFLAAVLARARDEAVKRDPRPRAVRRTPNQSRIWMHLAPDAPECVVNQDFHDPVRRVELVHDGELVGSPRLALRLVADSLLLLDVEKLVDPAEEVRR